MATLTYIRSGRTTQGSGGGGGGGRIRAAGGRRGDSFEEVELDFSKQSGLVLREILQSLSRRDGVTKGQKLAYLNAFVKFIQEKGKEREEWGFGTSDILLCLRVCLVHEATVIRVATLRVLRYLLSTADDVLAVKETGIPFLIVRSLDILLNNSAERLQAIRLCQRLLAIPDGGKNFPPSVTRALIAIGFDGQAEGDKLYKASLSLLCHLALLNPMQFIECGGVRVLLHNILGCTSSPMVLEAMVGSLLHLLNVPETREASGVNLQDLVAPFTDVHFKYGANEPSDRDLDEREVGYQCAKTAIGVVLKSWGGIAHFCQSRNSGLQALIDALYIEQLEIRRTILDLICEILGVKFPTWSDEVSVALSAVDPSSPQERWSLSEGFLVEEALSVLPHLAYATPNITANHMALIVLSFLQRGLLEALVEVIVTGDTFISVRSTVLLGELLHLVDKFIPLQCYDPTHCIPSLIRYSASKEKGSGVKSQRAMEALSVLTSLQKLKAKPPTPHSLFLQSQLEYASYQPKAQGRFINKLGHVQVTRLLKRDIEGNPNKLLKDTGVLNSKDPTTWQWDTILSLIKWAPTNLKRVDDSSWHSFLKRLIEYVKPSSNLFAKLELGKGQSKLIAKTACALVTFLAEEVQNFNGSSLLENLLVDIATNLDEILRQPQTPYSCFLSPMKVDSTLSQIYFLLVGRLTQNTKGYKVLEKGDILMRFFHIVCQVEHISYTKLIIGSLCYREDFPKRILGAALCSQFDSTRLFATQFLRILVRAKLSGFAKWGMELLVNQLGDRNRAIALATMDILEEAIYDKMFLESLISLRPNLTHLGNRGLLLLVTFLSLPSGFKFRMESNWLRDEIQKWKTSFNKKYNDLLEVLVRDSVSTLRRGEDGKYPERASRNQEQRRFVDIYVPPHLYGQLVHHKEGLELLLEEGDISGLIQTVIEKKCGTQEETRELKASLWALAHFATSVETVPILEENKVIESMVEIGRECPVMSVRHTVFHCLCLICVTVPGADALARWGWHAMPRNHHESFTIWSPELFITEETKRLLRLRVEREIPEEEQRDDLLPDDDDLESSIAQLDIGEVEDDEASEEMLLMEEMDLELKTSSVTDPSAPISWSHAHHRSNSDPHALSRRIRSTSTGSVGARGKKKSVTMAPTTTTSSASSSTAIVMRLRKDSVTEESTTSGVSSSDSLMQRGGGGDGGISVPPSSSLHQHHHTLSPIPSSASIATAVGGEVTQSPPSRGSSRATLTEPALPMSSGSVGSSSGGGTGRFYTSPHHHRSIRIRKPIIRPPIPSSDSDFMSSYPYPGRRMSTGGGSATSPTSSSFHHFIKTGSLDRHMILSPGDLFEAHKMMRVNSSVTSLSTPSFRVRPENELKGPCYMGLCVPDDFSAIFLTQQAGIPMHVRMSSLQEEDTSQASTRELHLGDSFEFHSTMNCLGCYKLRDETPSGENADPHSGLYPSQLSLSSIERLQDDATELEKYGTAMLRKEVLTLVSNLICCVGAKANEQGLLRLKQKFPKAFQDLCLYTELSVVMSKYNLRLPLRRFLQELFYDNSFIQFYEVAHLILEPQDESKTEEPMSPKHKSGPGIGMVNNVCHTSLHEEDEEEVDSGKGT